MLVATNRDTGDASDRLRAGDRRAAAELYQRWRAPVFDLLLRRLGNVEEAENLAQEALLRALEATRAQEIRRFGAYAMRVAHNLATDLLRRRRFTGPAADAERALLVLPDPHAPEHRRLREAVQQLPRDQREVVLLRYDEGLSYGEIAQTLGMSKNGVFARHNRAIATLRGVLSRRRG